MDQLRKASGKTENWLSRIRENNVLGINLKNYKENPEGFQNIIGLVGLTATIIFIFSILNIFTFGEREKTAESDKSGAVSYTHLTLPTILLV